MPEPDIVTQKELEYKKALKIILNEAIRSLGVRECACELKHECSDDVLDYLKALHTLLTGHLLFEVSEYPTTSKSHLPRNIKEAIRQLNQMVYDAICDISFDREMEKALEEEREARDEELGK